MSKKNAATSGITHARIRTPDGRHISAASAFPADQHVATNPQRDLPNPTAALTLGQISERQRIRAATVCQDQRDARSRREALAILEREDARRDAIAHGPAPTVREDLQAVKRRPWDAPMATRIGALPDPLAVLAWETIAEDAAATARSWWDTWGFSAALAVWSAACFLLGRLA